MVLLRFLLLPTTQKLGLVERLCYTLITMKRIRFTLVNTSLPYELTLNNQTSIDNYSNVIQRGKQVFGSDLSMLGQGALTTKTKDLDFVSGLLNFAQLIQQIGRAHV